MKKSLNAGNIAIVVYPGLSGVAQYSFCLARGISYLCPGIHLICNRSVDYSDSELDGLNIRKIFRRTRVLPADLLRFISIVLKDNIRIVHFQDFLKTPELTFFICILLKMFKRKTLFTVHDVLPHYPKFYHYHVLNKFYQNLDCIIAHSSNNRKRIYQITPNIKRIQVIPHGSYDIFLKDTYLSMEQARKHLKLPDNNKILLFFGRIDPRKGVEAIIREIPKLLKFDRNIFFVIAGRDMFPKGYLLKLISSLEITKHIAIFNRWINDNEVQFFFKSADVIVLPYIEGSTSGVLKIAMAFDKPVIATKVGELPEIIKKTKSGILIDLPLSDDDIKKIMLFLDVSKRQDRIFFDDALLRDYSWDSIAEKTVGVYKTICDFNLNNTK